MTPMSDRPFDRRCRGGRVRPIDTPTDASGGAPSPCTRGLTDASPRAERDDSWLVLDGAGRPALGLPVLPPGTVEEHARAICRELGELVGRPVELVSVRANPLGRRTMVSVATREVGRDGPLLRVGAASGTRPSVALVDALVSAHLGSESLLRAAAGRLTDDRVLRSALLVEGGAERWFGVPDRGGPLPRLVTGGPVDTSLAGSARVVRTGSAVLAVTVPDAAAARLFDLWSGAIARRVPESTSRIGTRP
jgi:hypothetical protein